MKQSRFLPAILHHGCYKGVKLAYKMLQCLSLGLCCATLCDTRTQEEIVDSVTIVLHAVQALTIHDDIQGRHL